MSIYVQYLFQSNHVTGKTCFVCRPIPQTPKMMHWMGSLLALSYFVDHPVLRV